jgi:hypothetical protein
MADRSTARLNTWAQSLAPGINFSVDASEPANTMFTTSNFKVPRTRTSTTRVRTLTDRTRDVHHRQRRSEPDGQYDTTAIANNAERSTRSASSFRTRGVCGGLTVNAGLRWQLQLPFQPSGDNYTTATYADVFRRVRPDANATRTFPAERHDRRRDAVRSVLKVTRLQIDYGNLGRRSVGHGRRL